MNMTIKTQGAVETPALGTINLQSESTSVMVFRGKRSYSEGNAYTAGRISVRREGGIARLWVNVGGDDGIGGSATLGLNKAAARELIAALQGVFPSL